jgi:hypothetical protein
MLSAMQKQKLLIHEQKQLQAKFHNTQSNISRLRKSEKDLAGKEAEAKAVLARQRELLDLGE